MGQDLRSPKRNVLRQLEGNPGDIDKQARDLVTASGVMQKAADKLQKLADGTDTNSKAESVDDVRESAGDVAPDLEKAAIRYQMTGDALITYASALETAQIEIRPKIEDIEGKHAAVQTARSEASQGWYSELQNPGAPAKSSSEQAAADRALETAEGELQTAWDEFDDVFGVWEGAYDKAIEGIDDAFDAADNNDAWGEDFLTALGYVGAILCVVALICGGWVAVVIGAIGLAIAAVILAITIMKRAKGRGSNADLAWAIVGVVPFVRPLKTAKGALRTLRDSKTTMAAGKATLHGSVLRKVPTKTKPTRRKPSKKIPPDRRRGIANRRTERLWRRFERDNSWTNRVKMNFTGGGHSNVTALGNFVRAKGEKVVGANMVAWADNYAPAISTATKRLVRGEVVLSFGVAGDFVANEWVPQYSRWRNQ